MGSATVFGGSIPAELSLPGSISCIEASVEQMIVRSERLVRVRVRARARARARVRVVPFDEESLTVIFSTIFDSFLQVCQSYC